MRFCELKGKKTAVWGLGREGLSFLRQFKARLPEQPLTVLDETVQPDTVQDETVRYIRGAAVKESLTQFDVIVKSPGISAYRPEIAVAKKAGVVFTSATALWFAEHEQETIVSITGTKGKSTTAALTAHLLVGLGYPAVLAGNIGKPLLDAEGRGAETVWVVELSSYQICGLQANPSIGVLLNLYAEHNDWHGSVEQYINDKLELFRKQKGKARSIINREDARSSCFDFWHNPLFFNDSNGLHVKEGFIWDGTRRLFPAVVCPLPGRHNLSNLCAALSVLKLLGLKAADAGEALKTFSGLPHRMQPVGECNGVTFIDDSISTIPESALAAVATFSGKPVTILVGGYKRAQDWPAFVGKLLQLPLDAVITMPDSGKEIAAEIRRQQTNRNSSVKLEEASSLAEAVMIARKITPPGGIVLLSPAAPSYGRFRNYEERGLAFRQEAFK